MCVCARTHTYMYMLAHDSDVSLTTAEYTCSISLLALWITRGAVLYSPALIVNLSLYSFIYTLASSILKLSCWGWHLSSSWNMPICLWKYSFFWHEHKHSRCVLICFFSTFIFGPLWFGLICDLVRNRQHILLGAAVLTCLAISAF